MKLQVKTLLEQSIDRLIQQGAISKDSRPDQVVVERPRQKGHGEFASGVALRMARGANMKPRDLAELIRRGLPEADYVAKTEIAGPGFVNFFLADHAYAAAVSEIMKLGDAYGIQKPRESQRVLIEFVSANPTGPLHVGHGRGAAYGDSLARVMKAAGYAVETEYYVNDIGRQVNILSLSVWIRYLQKAGGAAAFPQGAYQGDYIVDIAAAAAERFGSDYVRDASMLHDDLPDDPDAALDVLVARFAASLGESAFSQLRAWVLEHMVEQLRGELKSFGIEFDRWFAESSVTDSGEVEDAIGRLRERGWLYEKEGAAWFRSSEFGDEKDRVVIRSNGALTYFASDIAYHLNKFSRGYNEIINIWGADHHGYITRMTAAMEAAGEDAKRLRILLVQFASLYRAGKKIQMSTRAGAFVTLTQLIEEIGVDAARFFYSGRKSEQHMDFDLDLAKSQSSENPVYYVQYAHARVASIFKQMQERNITRSEADLSLLTHETELVLMKRLSAYPEIVDNAAAAKEPHQIAYYLRELANDFHSFYNKERVLDCERPQRDARLDLVDAARQVLANGLGLLGVSAPESM